ncbi:MAG: nuclear transport factor 2 family protein [Alphaproteobacteria bacterium]|nr:nuclear transport factor 2 family protein [Alphaproteobacteria bacterium]
MNDAQIDAIERACEKISISYARHIDFFEYDAFVNLFTEDGELQVLGATLKGRNAMMGFLTARPANRKSLHIFTNIWTNVIDENHAEGVTYLSLFRADQDGEKAAKVPGPMMAGYYRDKFVRTPKGWRFARRDATMLFACPV